MNKLFLLLLISFVICVGIEIFFQTNEKIYGIGIIAMLFLSLCLIHDMFLVKEKRK